MKRNRIILLFCLLVTVTILKAQINTKTIWRDHNDNVNVKEINKLIVANQLDAAENYCYFLSKMDSIGTNTLELALATIFLKKNLNDQAYDIVLKDVDYNARLNGGGKTPLQMLYDYTFGPELANDTLLEQMSINKVKDFYATYPFPEGTSGFKIILLNHKMNKLRASYQYQLSLLPHIKDSIQLFNNYQTAAESLIESFKELIDNHKGFYGAHEIGLPSALQFQLIASMLHLKDHEYFLPYFNDAFNKKEIAADEYVSELVNIESFKNRDSLHLQHYNDSLASKYFTNISFEKTILTDSTLFIIDEKWDSIGHKTMDTIVKNRRDIPKSPNPSIYKNLGEN
jgi:hypothetical protein